MAFELRQEFKLSQQLVMTPQLQQAIKLLQQTRLELVESMHEEIETNPVLECTGEDVEGETEAPKKAEEQQAGEVDWQTYLEQTDNYSPGGVNFSNSTEESFYETTAASEGGIREHLSGQLGLIGLSDDELIIGAYIIGNIDNDGFLRLSEASSLDYEEQEACSLKGIAEGTGASVEDAARVLDVVQSFDPPGAAARSTRECLILQARCMPVRDVLVEEIILNYLTELANKNYKLIASRTGTDIDDIIEAARTIVKELNPLPGAGFGEDESTSIVPDVYIKKVEGEYVIISNDSGMPKLKISQHYKEMLKNPNGMPEAAREYIQERFRSALWLIKSVQQRQKTIYRVVQSIIKFQEEFLDKGVKYLKPLTLKDVADDIGVHESTVSRVTSNKYADTPRGILRLKYFFSSSLSNTEGVEVAVEYIKNRMSEMIASEEAAHPLSDMKIVKRLGEQGITLSRRTATKYREAMGVLSSHKRKRLF